MFNSFIVCPVSADSITLTGFICKSTLLVLEVVPVLVALALIYFLWGVSQWILNLNNEEKMREGRTRTIWGLVALFFIVSIGGIIAILMNTFFFGGVGGGGGLVRPVSSITTPTVQAPINTTVQGSGQDIGFFRSVWCRMPFGDQSNC